MEMSQPRIIFRFHPRYLSGDFRGWSQPFAMPFSFGIDWRGGGERGIPCHRKSNPLFADHSGESFAMTIMQDGVLYARC